MNAQESLFDRALEPGHGFAHRNAPWTSQEGRRDAITTEKQARYLTVLLEADARGEVGCTDHAAAARTRLPLSSINSLRNALGDFVCNSGTWGQSPFGKPVIIWSLTAEGRAALAEYKRSAR